MAAVFLLGATMSARADAPLELTVGMYRIQAEVAYTEAGRERGLMYRKEMLGHQGMLFVFPMLAQHCMWMKNTDLPLAVAFMDENGKIINVEEMEPHTENNHCAKQPARFALEMNSGWFKQRGLSKGTQIRGVEKAPAPR
jgi:uncharacterized membrane protein (UPF0127 family)